MHGFTLVCRSGFANIIVHFVRCLAHLATSYLLSKCRLGSNQVLLQFPAVPVVAVVLSLPPYLPPHLPPPSLPFLCYPRRDLYVFDVFTGYTEVKNMALTAWAGRGCASIITAVAFVRASFASAEVSCIMRLFMLARDFASKTVHT